MVGMWINPHNIVGIGVKQMIRSSYRRAESCEWKSTTRQEWHRAYRLARIVVAVEPNNTDNICTHLRDLEWLAYAVLQFHRNTCDWRCTPASVRLAQIRIADEIISEIIREENK